MEKNIKKDITHSFHLDDVEKFGSIEKALIIKEIKNMALYKLRNGKDGWVYYSAQALSKKFCYMKKRSITRWLIELEEGGYLKSEIRNKHGYDSTKSYFITELSETEPLGQNGSTELSETETLYQKDQYIGQNGSSVSQNGSSVSQNGSSVSQNGPRVSQNGPTRPSLSTTLSTTLIKNSKTKVLQTNGKEINDLISLFKEVNPSYQQLFKNKTQRSALERLVKQHGQEKIEWAIKLLSKTNKTKFAPVICTPLQLESKLGQLIAFMQKEKSDKINIEI